MIPYRISLLIIMFFFCINLFGIFAQFYSSGEAVVFRLAINTVLKPLRSYISGDSNHGGPKASFDGFHGC